jgi:putative membrane protein
MPGRTANTAPGYSACAAAITIAPCRGHGVEVPKDNSDTSVLDELKPLKDKQFDDAYIAKIGVKGHQDAIAAFKKEISDGQNADLKKLAKKGLPVIEHHYAMAQQLAKKKGVQE